MAALPEASLPDRRNEVAIVELMQVPAHELIRLFAEEIEVWRRKFHWDFRSSADLLARYVQTQSLVGYALRAADSVVGYAYFICEHRKGLIGDFFISERWSNPQLEFSLLESTVGGLVRVHGIRRIESQLMNLRHQSHHLPFPQYLRRFDRMFMELDISRLDQLPETTPEIDVAFVPWAERYNEQIAHLVAAAYRGHVDSDINDQYRNIPGARHFLTNIIRYPGCGTFSGASSVVAIDRRSGKVCGVCLASKVAADSGHITQLCTLPALRGAHLGYELIRRSLMRLREYGSKTVSLTVTGANNQAVRLYESLGFEARWLFPALVWEGF